VTLQAKPEKREELASWLREMQAHAREEAGTITWYAHRIDEDTFDIYDTFAGHSEREAHIHGEIVKSLRRVQHDLLATPPSIRQVDLLAVKEVGSE
jgi:quinol monooxygenase YgiN